MPYANHNFMQSPVYPSFGRVKNVSDGLKYGWTDKEMKEQKRSSKTIDNNNNNNFI